MTDIHQLLHHLSHQLEHRLPGQAPIRDFVHHNTLHGYQDLPFAQAVAQAEVDIGHRALPTDVQGREWLRQGRVTLDDLRAALEESSELRSAEPLGEGALAQFTRGMVQEITLRFPVNPLQRAPFNWEVQSRQALTRCQRDLPDAARERLLTRAGLDDESRVIGDLWTACLDALGLEHRPLHPEELLELTPEQAQTLSQLQDRSEDESCKMHGKREAHHLLDSLTERVGQDWTLRDLLRALTGEDVLDTVRPLLVRQLGAHLDQGLAAWSPPQREQGFYASWRAMMQQSPHWLLQDAGDEWAQRVERLEDDPAEVIAQELTLLGLPEARWAGYLTRLAQELPGWSGMLWWRASHPGYEGLTTPVSFMDYLAVRLILEHVHAHRITRQHFRVEPSLPLLRWYFHHHPAELMVRHSLFRGPIPEYLADLIQPLVHREDEVSDQEWGSLAQLVQIWKDSAAAESHSGHSVLRSAWPLFRLAQHLGLDARELQALGEGGANALLECARAFDARRRGWVWLLAFERHYREQVLHALAANHGRGPWAVREPAPGAQIIFCMDDREEGLRRHLEELMPEVETLGAAAHFNVPHAWRGLDDLHDSALCPVIPEPVLPAHRVVEEPRPDQLGRHQEHCHRLGWRRLWQERFVQDSRRGVWAPLVLSALGAPGALALLAGRLLAPAATGRWLAWWHDRIELKTGTRLSLLAPADSPVADTRAPRLGFTLVEQADRVQALLRNTGLTYGFSPLVVIMGHASRNQNNPHAPAYNCGACAGRFSGPNARVVATMANDPAVRTLLAERGIQIPPTTWFMGSEHDTCYDRVDWYDLEDAPEAIRPLWERLRTTLVQACHHHAQERSRRFMSAELSWTAAQAHQHVAGRANDLSQARPELGHATNACAIFGRRALSRGAFFDRRAFLISYDSTQDPDGAILERHLLINGAVGAGISLEYYFSTINNEGYGCSSKTMHNLCGLLGVQEGASSDLRTGLPRQMIEIHEAMRLLVVVEQNLQVVTDIYQRQPKVRELVGNGWVQLICLEPDRGTLHRFMPGQGWALWQSDGQPLPKVDYSRDWFTHQREALAPVLLRHSSLEVMP